MRLQDPSIWELFQAVFAWLPLASVVNSNIFCVHGGLSPLLKSIQMINDLTRPILTYEFTPLVCDLVWSDPNETVEYYKENNRGAGVLFGKDVLRHFLFLNNLKLVVRAHQCIASGVSTFCCSLGVTVFSSSNYISMFPNKSGAIFVKTKNSLEFHSFSNGCRPDRPILMKFVPKLLGTRKKIQEKVPLSAKEMTEKFPHLEGRRVPKSSHESNERFNQKISNEPKLNERVFRTASVKTRTEYEKKLNAIQKNASISKTLPITTPNFPRKFTNTSSNQITTRILEFPI